MLQDIPADLQGYLKVGPVEEVTFTQLSAAVNTYRDAVRFKNGRRIRFQELGAGQRVKVLDLFVSAGIRARPGGAARIAIRLKIGRS